MRRNKNEMNIEGKIYQSKLEIRTVANTESKNYGKEFISGTLDVAVDNDCSNIVPVHYTYVTAQTAKGTENRSFKALKEIIESGKTVIEDGPDAATIVRLQPSLGLNDFYSDEELVSVPRNEGGFVTILRSEKSMHPEGDEMRNQFKVDIVISNVTEVTPDEGDPYVNIRGVVFDFRNAILPVTLVARNPAAVKYFLDLNASPRNPVYTMVWGQIINTYEKSERKIEVAFGDDVVEEVQKKKREYLVTHANRSTYVFDTEDTITAEEFQKAAQDRELYLASVKKKSDEYRASKQSAPATTGTPSPQVDNGFKFLY